MINFDRAPYREELRHVSLSVTPGSATHRRIPSTRNISPSRGFWSAATHSVANDATEAIGRELRFPDIRQEE